jgi:hypothetical protein
VDSSLAANGADAGGDFVGETTRSRRKKAKQDFGTSSMNVELV